MFAPARRGSSLLHVTNSPRGLTFTAQGPARDVWMGSADADGLPDGSHARDPYRVEACAGDSRAEIANPARTPLLLSQKARVRTCPTLTRSSLALPPKSERDGGHRRRDRLPQATRARCISGIAQRAARRRARPALGDTDSRRNDCVVAEAGVNREMPVRADPASSGEPGELLPEKPALGIERTFPPVSDVSGRVSLWLLAASDSVGGGCGGGASDQFGD